MKFFALLVFFVLFPYEYVLFGEDVLFGISFVIFIYYIINSVSDFFYSALDARRVYVLNLFKFYFTFLVATLNDLLADLAYFSDANLDKNFVSSLASLLTVIDYSTYAISTDLEFNEEDRNLMFADFVSSVNVQYETESTVLDFFNK